MVKSMTDQLMPIINEESTQLVMLLLFVVALMKRDDNGNEILMNF